MSARSDRRLLCALIAGVLSNAPAYAAAAEGGAIGTPPSNVTPEVIRANAHPKSGGAAAPISSDAMVTTRDASTRPALHGTGLTRYRALIPLLRTPLSRAHAAGMAKPGATPYAGVPPPRSSAAAAARAVSSIHLPAASLAATPGNGVIGGPRGASHGVVGGAANVRTQLKAGIDGSALRRRF